MSSTSDTKGSAAVDFLLVVVPLMIIFFATVSITLYSYLRSVLLDATIEGVRYASLADQDIQSGIARTKKLIYDSIGTALPLQIRGQSSNLGSLEASYLETSLTLIGAESKLIQVTARATREIQ